MSEASPAPNFQSHGSKQLYSRQPVGRVSGGARGEAVGQPSPGSPGVDTMLLQLQGLRGGGLDQLALVLEL